MPWGHAEDDRGVSVADNVIVTAADDQLADIEGLAERLRSAGMDVDQVLSVGVITGSVPASRRASLAAVHGVDAVEDDGAISIPPPDSDIQ